MKELFDLLGHPQSSMDLDDEGTIWFIRSSSKLYGPIKELLSEDNPPKYRETTIANYVAYHDCSSAFTHYKIWYLGNVADKSISTYK
jgi:hypothetical protein